MIISNKNTVVLGFVFLFVFVSVYLLYAGYKNLIDSHEQAKDIIGVQETKHRLVTKLYAAARERSLILLTMHSTTDVFELDELNQKMGNEASDFISAREKLDEMEMSNKELEIYKAKKKLVRENYVLQNQVAKLFIEDQRQLAERIMFNSAIPGQRLVLDKISEMLELYESISESVIDEIDGHNLKARKEFQLLLFLVIVSSIIIAIIIYIISRKENKENKKAADHMTYLVSHDPLTGLFNRWSFEKDIENLLKYKKKTDVHYVLYLDLDQFKIINDTCGHNAGDNVLKDIANIIQGCVRKEDVVARIGGDEFGIVLKECHEIPAKETARSVVKAVERYRYYFQNKVFRVGVSVGVSVGMVCVNGMSTSAKNIMQKIDSACYVAKDNGGGRFHLYNNSSQEILQRKTQMGWLVKIDHALENDGFELYAQPIVPVGISNGKYNYEVLIRMKNDNGELVTPDKFLASAERYNKMVAIDQWVIENTFTMISANDKYLQSLDYCSINISCQSLTDDDFLDFIVEQFSLNKNLENKICFEITETAAISNPLKANRCISVLRNMGVRFALDDFGCGLALFEYLKKLSVDYLKIDGMFIKDIVSDPIDRAMVKSIVEVGKIMNKTIIAEYVENYEIVKELQMLGVDYAQGYGVGKPKPLFMVINENYVELDELLYIHN